MVLSIHVIHNPFLIDAEIGQTGAIYELFCTKDIGWKYQKEWRLVGNARDHFKEVDIKAVEGNPIKEWKSAKEAGEALKISAPGITGCCKGYPKYNTAGGFKWRYKTKNGQ